MWDVERTAWLYRHSILSSLCGVFKQVTLYYETAGKQDIEEYPRYSRDPKG